MINEKLNSSFYKKNAAEECFTKSLNIFVKSLKKLMLILLFVPNIIISPHELTAESQGREIQNYVKSGTTLQARNRKAYENAQKESGLKIKSYLINKSAIQSKKGKSAAASQKMVESGLVTLEMFKKNRWFIKNPAQSSYTKLQDYEESKKISREALKMSKYRARITGPVKPDYLYAESHSRDALKMTRTRARITGPAKPGIIFAEDVGRDAMKISKTRAVATGPVKPETLYSEQASRDAKKISIKTAKEYTTDRRDMSVYSNILESMSKRPALNSKPVNIEKTSKK
ncbi:MAG: hypothetical protein NZ878_09130 [SAR324 cluster bacterium]|nr:hypothetical protein [SAR324 cluster bacterium]